MPDARVARCAAEPAVDKPGAFIITARVAGSTNAVRLGVQCVYDGTRRLQALVMDQPLRLPDGVRVAATTALPIETVMHALAIARHAPTTPGDDLTLKTAKMDSFYGDKDYHKGTMRTMIRGSVPVPYESFSQITEFAIMAMPTMEGVAGPIHTFSCMSEGISTGKKPKYTHYFMASADPEVKKPCGFFIATLHDNTLDFVYTWITDDVYSETDYNKLRAKMASTPAIFRRSLKYGLYTVAVNGDVHSANGVPLLMRGSKSRATAVKVKPPKAVISDQ
ncbi:MAG: hypothetical protein NTV22_18865 [bacterium]|nr:hypothetical protein [bacterium]